MVSRGIWWYSRLFRKPRLGPVAAIEWQRQVNEKFVRMMLEGVAELDVN